MGEICRWHKLDQNMMIAVTPLLVVSSYVVMESSYKYVSFVLYKYWVHSM